MDFSELRAEIIFEIGPDAYSQYDQERYAIPEIVLHILADACIIEFIKGFVDFEALGKGVRAKLEQFIEAFRQSPQLVTLNISQEVDRTFTAAKVPDQASLVEAHKRLVDLLIVYGMDKDIAEAHAGGIEKSIMSTLHKQQGEAAANA